jgi:hypothetical protein
MGNRPATPVGVTESVTALRQDPPWNGSRGASEVTMPKEGYAQGMLVEHAKFGLGKILEVHGGKAHIHFRDDGQDSRQLSLDSMTLVPAPTQSDPMLDSLPPFRDGKFATKRKRVLWGDGIAEFRRCFPGGFSDPAFIGTENVHDKAGGERGYKVAAHELWVAQLGEGRAVLLLEHGEIDELAKRALAVVARTNLLSPFEAMALRDGFAFPEPARRFFEALLPFIDQPPTPATFAPLADAVLGLPAEPGRARVATWPVLTILPFLARPDRFMFLKPEITQECAERMRFDLQYDSALRWITYERLMKLSDVLLEKLRPLGARDYIDVQSFMWVIAKY